ncbi:enoyl-CoA hydratase/isomerase family protein [Streptomyces sp. M2CJ-2]|uniref:enoyl-CoA hydratase/isomerase family protein n=1 Tax=Streptomyces sp. M2CJ-2 TaxID=2803948 RepID=UPI0019276D80|nr:enoyl-CoA hydratase-related protein [Streptomyces sp. M2CJ-2]MBL3670367.1 enoyl-CoA hydratase/isomerase family protein [Streptomyces sp. M2CJ-2]
MEPQLLHSVTEAVATVVIDHPAKRNAMTTAMWRALPPLLDTLADDPGVRALVLTGEGGTFCAGADISTLRGSPREAQRLAVAAEEALAAFPKPTLAAIRGHCVGGGAQLAAACDLRFAQEGAVFGVTPARLGIVYPASSTRRLVSLVGPSAAKYLLFSGELIDTGRALRTGLVDEVLPEGELDHRVAEFTRILASRSQLTQAAAKEFANGRTDRDDHWGERAHGNGDTAEGVAAFLERRPPRFTWSLSDRRQAAPGRS